MGPILAIKLKRLCDLRSNAERHIWDSPLGQRSLAIEHSLMATMIARLHGETVVWIGDDLKAARRLHRSMIKNPVFLAQDLTRLSSVPEQEDAEEDGNWPLPQTTPVFAASLGELPLQSRSVDGVVLHHALEVERDPRVALRETARVLAPGGRLVICGYNPWSLLGLRRIYAQAVPDLLRQRRLLNPLRLFDWLTLLGFELDGAPAYAGTRLLLDRYDERADATQMHEPSRFPFGGIIALTAVKQSASYSFRWEGQSAAPKLAPVAYPRISSWQRR